MLAQIDKKIRRMHASLESLSDADFSAIEATGPVNDAGHFYATVDFNAGTSEIEMLNLAMALFANIATMKDHINKWCRSQGMPAIGDSIINSNLDVAIVHDLWNIDKHGGLDRAPRSGRTPQLRDVRRSLSLSSGTAAGSGAMFVFDPRTGKVTSETTGDGSASLELDGTIVDENGTQLGRLSEIAGRAAAAWEKALRDAGVPP